MQTKEKAYAKINLFLDVVGRRDDRFHDIKTVMHTISLCDDIEVEAIESADSSYILDIIDSPAQLSSTDNLILVAARRYAECAGISAHVSIKLNKRIPIAAGLAGGSSDAAAVLRAMNRIFENRLSKDELLSVASEIGSDVPYCLVGGTALCEGRGEIIKPLYISRKMHFAVAVSNETVSTPMAYSALDRLYSNFDGSVPAKSKDSLDRLLRFLNGASFPENLYNVFEQAVLPSCSGAAMIKEKMLEYNALAALMSGSGPSVFGIFENKESAERCVKLLSECEIRAYYAFSV